MQKSAKGWTNAAYLLRLGKENASPVSFMPDGRRILAFGKLIYVWDSATDSPVKSFAVDGSLPTLSPGGTRLATVTKATDGLLLWDMGVWTNWC